MARLRSGVKRATARKVLHGIIALSLFTLHIQQSLAIEANGQVFIQTDNELKFMIDGIPLPVTSADGLYNSIKLNTPREKLFTDGRGIHFFPSQLDFSRQPVGMPKMEQVTVINSDPLNSLHLLSISGSTVHFHCSFFQDKMVPPGGNTTFDVVFLARQIGNVENTLYIHTSQGTFKYQVFGVGTANPYRLKPLVGARVPVNGSFSPVIHLHNPHSTPLQVIEMFSSGGDLHLELPISGSSLSHGGLTTHYSNASYWELKPYETRPLMRASFVGRSESNHTAYIRIRTTRESSTMSELLVLPLEVEVTSDPGLYSPSHMLDFGLMRSTDAPRQQKLLVVSSVSRVLKIASVTVVPQNEAVSIILEEPMRVQAGLQRPTVIATVTFDPSRASRPRQLSGKIVIRAKTGGYSLVVPYCADVVPGDLIYSEATVQFYVGDVASDGGSLSRSLVVSSTFDNPVMVTRISLRLPAADFEDALQVSYSQLPLPLLARQPTELLTLTYARPRRSSAISTNGKLIVPLILYANVSTFTVPLCIYDGKLKVTFQHSEKELDFGTLGFGESRILYFTLTNENPVSVTIQELFATAGLTIIDLHAVEKGNASLRLPAQQGAELSRVTHVSGSRRTEAGVHLKSATPTGPQYNEGKEMLVLGPYEAATYRVNLTAPSEEAIYSVDARVTTNYETFYVPIRFQATEGSVRSVPERIVFEKAFPGKILFKVLKIRSSFAQHTQVTKISFVPNDSRFYYKPSLSTPAILEPYEDTAIGLLYFDASRTCGDDCYVGGLGTGVEASSTRQQQWIQGLRLDYNVVDIDQYLYARRRMKWDELVHYGRHVANVTVQIDTDPVRGFLFPVQAKLHWPTIIKERKINFPVTQIGNLSVESVVVENPLDTPLLIQILPVSLYPNPTLVLDLIESSLVDELESYIEIEDTDVFTLQNLEVYNRAPSNPVTKYRRHIESTTGVEPHPHSIATVLSPGVRVNVLIGFEPRDAAVRSSVILVRNNLTIIDALIVQGKGAYSEVVVSERVVTVPAYLRSYESSPPNLIFNLNEKVMQNCDVDLDTHLVFSGKIMKVYRSSLGFYMVKKTFVVQNLGELPVFVQDIRVNSEPCRDAGFEVLTCEGFELPANGSRKIDISYVPDFSQPIATASLNLETSAGDVVNSTLRAVTPARLLGRCAAALQRPFWEGFVLRCCVFVSSLTFIFVFAIAYVDMRRLFEASAEERTRLAARGTVFSLAVESPPGKAGMANLISPAVIPATRKSGTDANHSIVGRKKKQNGSDVPHAGSGALSAAAKPLAAKDRAEASRRSSGNLCMDLHRNSTDESVTGGSVGSDSIDCTAGASAPAGKGSDKHSKKARRRAAASTASMDSSILRHAATDTRPLPTATSLAGSGSSQDIVGIAAAGKQVNARSARDKKNVIARSTPDGCTTAIPSFRRSHSSPLPRDTDAGASSSGGEELNDLLSTSADAGSTTLPSAEGNDEMWHQKVLAHSKGSPANLLNGRSKLHLQLPVPTQAAASAADAADPLSSSPDSCVDEQQPEKSTAAVKEPAARHQRAVPVARCAANARTDVAARSAASSDVMVGPACGEEELLASKKPEAAAWCTRKPVQAACSATSAQALAQQETVGDGITMTSTSCQTALTARPQRLLLPECRSSCEHWQTATKAYGHMESNGFQTVYDAGDTRSESPTSPDWDMPRGGYISPSVDDFGDIALQTAAFASELRASQMTPAFVSATVTATVHPQRRRSSLGVSADSSQKGTSPSWMTSGPLYPPAALTPWPSPTVAGNVMRHPGPIGSRPSVPRRDQLPAGSYNRLSGMSSVGRSPASVTEPAGVAAAAGNSNRIGLVQRTHSMHRFQVDPREPLLDYEPQQPEHLQIASPVSENWYRLVQQHGLDSGNNVPWQQETDEMFAAPVPDIFSTLMPAAARQEAPSATSAPTTSPWGDNNWSIWSSPQAQVALTERGTQQETASNYELFSGFDANIWRPVQHSYERNVEDINTDLPDFQWATYCGAVPGNPRADK